MREVEAVMKSSERVSALTLFSYFFRLSCTALGGPLAYISMMEDECVERKQWLSRDEFTEMLGVTNMLPGPNATEMAIHIGYVKAGRIGGVLSGLGFTAPSFFMILSLSWLYFRYSVTPSVGGLFYGVNPVVVAIILITAYRLARSSITDWRLLCLFSATLIAVYFTNINEALILFASGLTGAFIYGPGLKKAFLGTLAFTFLAFPVLNYAFKGLPVEVLLFLEFLKAGSLMFGSGLVIIPLIGPDIVEAFKWMSYKEFMDGVTLGQVTPGPVMKTAAFVGYKVAGIWGATVAFSGVFLPPFITVTLLAPFLRQVHGNAWLNGFLKGVRAGAAGAIFAVAGSMAQIAFPDILTVIIAAASLMAMLRFKVNMSLLVIAAGALGVLIKNPWV
jgi:chromate transporter